jgi:spore germination cell wall hydrolase CwlJ-like protein
MKPEHAHIFKALADWQLMGLCIEREASGEPREGQIAVGTVILERVDHRDWDGKTIQEVILKPWQFSWTMPEAGEAYYDEAVWICQNWIEAYGEDDALRECCKVATDMLQGIIPRDPELAAVNCCQYLNPKIAHDTREKWLHAGMKVIKTIKNHEFFA